MTETASMPAEVLEGPADGLEFELEQSETGWPDVLSMETDAHGVPLKVPQLYVRASFPEHEPMIFYVHAAAVVSYQNGRRSKGLPEGTYAEADPAMAVPQRAD